MLAQGNLLEGDFMLKLLLGGLLLLQIANLIFGFVRGREAKRRSISFEGTPVDKSECEKHMETNRVDHDHMFAKMGGLERGIRAEVKGDMLRLEDKLSSLDRKVGGLTASNEEQNKQLGEMRSTLRDMPGEIIALLKNTGAIK